MVGEGLRGLLVEDNPGDARLVREALPNPDFEIVHVGTLDAARQEASHEAFDVVLLDLTLPDAHGANTVDSMLEAAPDLPIVVLTGLADEEVELSAIRRGVQDYVVKDGFQDPVLPRVVRHAIERSLLLSHVEKLRSEQLEAKEHLLSHVSHELRTPLNVVYQFLTIVLDEIAGPLSIDQRGHLLTVLENVNQLRTIIGDLLELTRIEKGTLVVEPEPTDTGRVVFEIVEALSAAAAQQGIEISVDISPDSDDAWVDPGRLRQILTNLLDNAIKFTPEGGRVGVAVGRLFADPDMLQISVVDSGVGIPPEDLPRIFGRMTQGSNNREITRKGLGLGLFICRELVGRHGGELVVESAVGRGTRFTFTIPVATESLRAADSLERVAPT